ncbi:MAG: hypothetical protein RL227_2867 [Pseudomonadota bacterium]
MVVATARRLRRPLASALRITSVTPASLAQDVREAANPMAGFDIGAELAGSREGHLRLNVCLDTACTRPIGNSPVVLPSRIIVVGGVRIGERGPIGVDVPFGHPSPFDGCVLVLRRAVSLVIPAKLSGLTAILPFDAGWVAASSRTSGAPWAAPCPGRS